jgi:basic membrane lipoprotein Med (substrate-binding protein (PBP1-ABC) superfamily)
MSSVGLLAVGIGLVSWLWPHGGRVLPPLRARAYSGTHACLLTGPNGLAEKGAAPVWAGMEHASVAHRIQVSYLAVSGPQTSANATSFVATLVQQKCAEIIGLGPLETSSVNSAAKTYKNVRFAAVDAPVGTGVVGIAAGDAAAEQAAVDRLVSSLAA